MADDETRDARELQVAIEGRTPSIVLPEGHGLTFTATRDGVEVSVGDKVLVTRREAFTVVVGSGPASGVVDAAAAAPVAERQRVLAMIAAIDEELRGAQANQAELEAVSNAREQENGRLGARLAAVEREHDEALLRVVELRALAANLAEEVHTLRARVTAADAVLSDPPVAPEPT